MKPDNGNSKGGNRQYVLFENTINVSCTYDKPIDDSNDFTMIVVHIV